MMKISKSSHKLPKSSRGSPIRKDHLMKKPMHSITSMRISTNTGRPPMKQHLPPGMKRGPPMPPPKSLHSPRLRSIASSPHRSVTRHSIQESPVSMDRDPSLRRAKYEKRKMSPNLIRRPMPSTSHEMRGPSPYHDERYLTAKPLPAHYLAPPPKKKTRREPDRFDRGDTPEIAMMRRTEVPPLSEGRMSHRNEMAPRAPMPPVSNQGAHRSHIASSIHDERSGHFDVHNRARGGPPPVMSSSHSKRPPPPPAVKPSYDTQRGERYRSPSPPNRFPPSSEKQYAPTLHERFSSVVVTNRTEPRIKYSREDLEKITIDIHRNLKAESPTLRRIVNPDDVKLVRRANEGHRPIFDREEIKQAPRDMRDEAYYEKKAMSSGGAYSSTHSMGLREVENYEITRHRFDPHHQAFHSSSGRSLSDRWQNPDGRKDDAPLDRDDREREYERQPVKRSFHDARRSKSGDRDFRAERYSVTETKRSRPDYPPNQHRIPPPPEPRSSVPIHRKESVPLDARRKLSVRRGSDRESSPPSMRPDSRSRYPPHPEKHYPEGLTRTVEKHVDRRSPVTESRKWRPNSRSESREKKIPDFPRRPDKYSYKSWPDKTDAPPRNSSYYEDGHEGSDSYRGRGGSRPFRGSRGLRTRGYRGASSRGSFPPRSSYRGGYGNSSNIRGRGAPRRGRFSPSLWEHDLYPRTSEDRKLALR